MLQSLNDILYLIVEGQEKYNDEDFLMEEESSTDKKEIFCKVESAKRTEYYAAMRAGVKISLVFVISSFDYEQVKEVEYEGKRYKVERTYQKSENYMELVCSEVE